MGFVVGGNEGKRRSRAATNATQGGRAAYFTLHSKMPADLSAGNSTSSLRAVVFTGLKFTVHALPFSVG